MFNDAIAPLVEQGKCVCLRFTLDGIEMNRGVTVVNATIKWLNIGIFSIVSNIFTKITQLTCALSIASGTSPQRCVPSLMSRWASISVRSLPRSKTWMWVKKIVFFKLRDIEKWHHDQNKRRNWASYQIEHLHLTRWQNGEHRAWTCF